MMKRSERSAGPRSTGSRFSSVIWATGGRDPAIAAIICVMATPRSSTSIPGTGGGARRCWHPDDDDPCAGRGALPRGAGADGGDAARAGAPGRGGRREVARELVELLEASIQRSARGAQAASQAAQPAHTRRATRSHGDDTTITPPRSGRPLRALLANRAVRLRGARQARGCRATATAESGACADHADGDGVPVLGRYLRALWSSALGRDPEGGARRDARTTSDGRCCATLRQVPPEQTTGGGNPGRPSGDRCVVGDGLQHRSACQRGVGGARRRGQGLRAATGRGPRRRDGATDSVPP